jgi:hypothetical protein
MSIPEMISCAGFMLTVLSGLRRSSSGRLFLCVKGEILIAQAQSGTGRSGTFCIGSLCRVDPTVLKPQIQFVICPTRELAQQIRGWLPLRLGTIWDSRCMLRQEVRLSVMTCAHLSAEFHFIVGTPGRIYDLMNRGALNRKGSRADYGRGIIKCSRRDSRISRVSLELGFPAQNPGWPLQCYDARGSH